MIEVFTILNDWKNVGYMRVKDTIFFRRMRKDENDKHLNCLKTE